MFHIAQQHLNEKFLSKHVWIPDPKVPQAWLVQLGVWDTAEGALSVESKSLVSPRDCGNVHLVHLYPNVIPLSQSSLWSFLKGTHMDCYQGPPTVNIVEILQKVCPSASLHFICVSFFLMPNLNCLCYMLSLFNFVLSITAKHLEICRCFPSFVS